MAIVKLNYLFIMLLTIIDMSTQDQEGESERVDHADE